MFERHLLTLLLPNFWHVSPAPQNASAEHALPSLLFPAASATETVQETNDATDRIPSIAVLPFEDYSENRDQDFFSKGLEMKQLDSKIADRLCFQYEVEGKDMALDFKVHKRKCEMEHLL